MPPSNGHISAYLDCNSIYSCFTYHLLLTHRPLLTPHNITLTLHPIFLGGINAGSGNKPPWTLPAKARMSPFDVRRAKKFFGRITGKDSTRLSTPQFFPIVSLLPLRCMLFIQEHFPRELYEEVFGMLWVWLWEEHLDISRDEVLGECLGRYFGKEDVEAIVAAGREEKWKKMLAEETGMLVEKGAYGAPWFLVRNKEGKEESFFGSDRFHFIYDFLEVPIRDMEILPPGQEAPKL